MKKYIVRLFADKTIEYHRKIKELRKRHRKEILIYGNDYRDTLEHDLNELNIAWLDFKMTVIIGLFNFNNIIHETNT